MPDPTGIDSGIDLGIEGEILPPLAPQPVAPPQVATQPALEGIRPGQHDQLPSSQGFHDLNRSRNKGQVVIEIGHNMMHRERRTVQTVHIVTSDPKQRMPVGTGFEIGLPMAVFGVPTETGRRYRVTVEETADSSPAPKRVPWNSNQAV